MNWKSQRVLVAILNRVEDFQIARDEHWYRIPITSVERWLRPHWPPRWLAFYQTKVFGPEAFAVRHYAEVNRVRQVQRWQLFPEEKQSQKHNRKYYQLFLGPLQRLEEPVRSRTWRRIIFIPTVWSKLISAREINDLPEASPLEDRLWSKLKQLRIPAEREFFIQLEARCAAVDFAIFCREGNLAVETDGDSWHLNPKQARSDNARDHSLILAGWTVLRFTTHQIRYQMQSYSVPTVLKALQRFGGLAELATARERVKQLEADRAPTADPTGCDEEGPASNPNPN